MDVQHDLKHVAARRISQIMAIVLSKKYNNADTCFRPCPEGLTDQFVLSVAISQ